MAKRTTRTKTGIVLLDPLKLVPAEPRRDQGDLSELKQSIEDLGLLQPILVAPDRKIVVAGRRRLAVVRLLGWTKVECLVRGDGSKIDELRIAIAENLHRKTLSDAETYAWIAQFHELKLLEHGSRPKGGRLPTGHDVTGWSLPRTAKDLSVSKGLVSKALRINEAITKYPELAKIKGGQVIVRSAKRLDALAAAPRRRDAGFVLGDALDAIPALDDRSVQLLLTDPPYGVNKRSSSKDPQLSIPIAGDQSPEKAAKTLDEVLTAMAPKLTEDAHAYIFTTLGESYLHLVPVIARFFDIHNNVVWVKANSGAGSEWFASTTEVIIFGTVKAAVGKRRSKAKPRPLFGKRLPDVVVRATVPTANRIHVTPKPVELLATLITKSTVEGELVADPFAGSASTLVAAKRTGRRYWGAEREEEYYNAALPGLAEAKFVDASPSEFTEIDEELRASWLAGYAFVADVDGREHVVLRPRWSLHQFLERVDVTPRDPRMESDKAVYVWVEGLDGAEHVVLQRQGEARMRPPRARSRYGPGLNDLYGYKAVCEEIAGDVYGEGPPHDLCAACARWLASHGDRDALALAAAGERGAWITGMVAPAEYDRVVKPKGRARPTAKPRAKKQTPAKGKGRKRS